MHGSQDRRRTPVHRVALPVTACMVLAALLSTAPVAVAQGHRQPLQMRAGLEDCGYGKRGLQITGVAARGVSCDTAWTVTAKVMKTVMGRWEQGWFPELYQSGDVRRFGYRDWGCSVRATSRESYKVTCRSGSRVVVSGTGA